MILSIIPFGIDEKPAIFFEEAGSDTIGSKSAVVEIAEYKTVGSGLHGHVVVRLLPVSMFLLMTTLTTDAASVVVGYRSGIRICSFTAFYSYDNGCGQETRQDGQPCSHAGVYCCDSFNAEN
jgi:hypothetical protein